MDGIGDGVGVGGEARDGDGDWTQRQPEIIAFILCRLPTSNCQLSDWQLSTAGQEECWSWRLLISH